MFKKPLFFYDPTAAGGQTPPGGGDGTQENTPDAGRNGGNNQTELDRQVAARAQRAAESARKELWTALGVTSQDEIEAFVKAKKEADDAQRYALPALWAGRDKAIVTGTTQSCAKSLKTRRLPPVKCTLCWAHLTEF